MATATNATVSRLGESGVQTGDVLKVIIAIAEQTNATKDIAKRIEAIQSGTKGAVLAISTIGKIIDPINGIAATIATAVEQQSATTTEISRNIDEATRGSGNITQHISGVASAPDATSQRVNESRKTMDELAQMSSRLHELVGQLKY
jgi:methyl-accepting chemotaxis protein